MLLSREKINHLSKLIVDNLDKNELIDFLEDDNEVRLQIVKIMTDELQMDEVADKKVREKLLSYSKKIYEGTDEWDVMYKKLFDEEMAKKKGFSE